MELEMTLLLSRRKNRWHEKILLTFQRASEKFIAATVVNKQQRAAPGDGTPNAP
jgi:hypothetical protein